MIARSKWNCTRGKFRVLHLCWEYPPRVVGSIAPCVKFLAEGLSRKSVDVYVIAFDDWSVGFTREGGVGVWRINNPVRAHVNMITWVMTLTQEFIGRAFDLNHEGKAIDLVHAHEWHAVPAAIMLKHSLDLPFIYTVYSTENLRSGYSNAAYNLAIKRVEWEGQYEAARLVVQDKTTKADVAKSYSTPPRKIDLIRPTYDTHWTKRILKAYEGVLSGN